MNTHHTTARSVKRSVRVRLRTAAALALAIAATVMLVPGAQAALSTGEPAASEYVPFVTDFPQPAASTATAESYVPFVTDFPSAAAVQAASTSGTDWSEMIAIGSGAGAALAALLAGLGLVLMRRARPARA